MDATIVSGIVLGVVIGALGWFLLPAASRPMGVVYTLVAAVAAGVVATLIAMLFNFENTPGTDWKELALQVVLPIAGIALVGMALRRRAT